MSSSSRWNVERAARWEKTRAKGKYRFILLVALAWGFPMAILMTVIHELLIHRSSIARELSINLLVFPLAGILFGILLWNRVEIAYRSYLSRLELRNLRALNAKP
jgi:hypothetical protein